MQVFVNNKTTDLDEPVSLASLIEKLGLDPKVLVAERNGEIVPKSDYSSCKLSPGDRVELVRLVGGG